PQQDEEHPRHDPSMNSRHDTPLRDECKPPPSRRSAKKDALPPRRKGDSAGVQARGGARDGVIATGDSEWLWRVSVQMRSGQSAVRTMAGVAAASTATVPVASRQAMQCVSTGQPSSVWAKDSSAIPKDTAARTSAAIRRKR